MQEAMDNRLIDINPLKSIKPPKFESRRAVLLTEEELRNFFAYIRNKPYSLEIIMTVYSGMRRGELVGLKESDFDFDKHTVTINRQVTSNRATGADGKYYGVREPKTPTSKRVLGVSDYIETLVKERIESNHRCRDANKDMYKDEGWLFAKEDGSFICPNTLYSNFKRYLRECIPDKTLHYHDLRHTYVEIMRKHGIDTVVISQSIGHKNVQITTGVYMNTIADRNEIAQVISDVIFPDNP